MPTNDIRIKRLYDTMARHYNMTEPFEDFADKFIGSEQARRKVYDAMARHYNMTESFEDFSKIATDGSFSGSQTRLNSSDDTKYQKQKITQKNASGLSQIGSNDRHTDKVYKETEAKEENKPASVSATGPAKRDPVLLAEEDFKRSKDSLLSRLIPSGDENFYTKLSEKEREVYWQRYQELEDNYKKDKKTSEEWAKANTWIKDELKEQRKEERKDKWKNLGKGLIRSIAYPAGTATGSVSYKLTAGDTPAQAQAKEWAEPYMKEYRESKAVARVLDESVKLFNAAEKGKGVGRGIIDDMAKIQTWDLGLSDMSHQMTLGTLYEKEERGEPLTATENEVLDAVAIASYVTEQVSPAVKRGYNVGTSLPQSLGFMFSLYINPASGLGKTVASRAIRRYGRRGVSKLTTRAIGTGARVFGDIAEMGIATATSGSGRVLAEAIERVNGSPTYEISPEGFVVYGGQRDKEEFGRAYAKAFGSNYIENWSEAVGDYFLPLIKPLDTTLKNVIDVKLRKKNLNGIADFLNSVPKSQLAGMVNDFKERTKFSGLIGEILEEEIGMLVEPLLIGDTTLKENFGVWSKDPQIRETARDNQLTTIFSCALMSGALGAVQVAGGRVAAKMDKDVRKAHQEGQRLFKKDWTDIKDRIDEAEPDQVVSITKDIAFNPNLSVEQRKAVVEYAYKRMINQQYNTTAKLARDEMTQTAQTLLTAYDAGYRMATASHPKGIRKAYIEAIEAAETLQQYDKKHHTDLFSTAEKLLTADMATRQMTLDGLGREQSELVEDYLAKTLRQTGIEDGTTDDVQDTVEAALSALDPVTTHDEQGNPVIITALTADDRVVYITGEQDKMSTITYEDTNETTVYPTDQLKDHVVQSKEDVINEFEAQIRERSRARLTHYSQHNDKTQPIQKGLVIGDGDAKIIVTDTGAGWATIQEAETDKESGQIVPKKDAPTRDVTHDYLLSLQDDIYDHRDMMDGMNQMAQMVAQEIKQAQQDTGVAPSDQEALRSRIAEWEERTGVKAIIATTIDEVTSKSAQEAITEGRIVNAWYEVETDRVGFYLPYIASVKEIDTGYMHEVVSHKGLRELLGQEKFDTLMDAVWRDLMTEEDRAHYLHYNRHLNLEGADAQRAAADEYVARVAESVDATEPMSNITEAWNKIVEYVRGILEELGLIDNTLTNDELSDVIKASLLNYEHKQLQARQLSEQQAQAQAEQQAKAQEQAGEEALSKIPPIQNKQGETIDYEWAKAPDIETALTAMRHLGYINQDIVQFALTYTDTLVGRHKKLKKSTPKSLPEQKAKRENIQAITQELSFWRGVRDQIQKETTPEIESRPREVQEQTNTEGIEGIAKRFNEGKRTRGIETTVILADGTEISGHYELTEAGDVTASHNPETFEQSEGFPTNENGSTVNDRDYQHDKAAQEAVKLKGQSYDKRAYQEPVIVSPDGVVYSGNDRTMAGIIAANNGADVKYNESLRQDIAQYGFTEEQFNEYEHPRLVFVTAETLPYTTETFARFNASERKSQDSTEKMVKSGKTTSDVTFQRLADLVQMYDDVFEMYNKGGAEIINLLIKEGVITSNDAAQHLDGDKLSRTGQEFVESLIIGYLFNQNDKTVRMLFADGMGNVRKAIIGSLSQLIVNRTMGEYSIQPEMEQAIEICYRAHRDHSGSVEGFLSQINLFTDDVNSKESSELAQQIALSINTGSVRLRGALDVYNNSFANDVGAVAGVFGKRTRDEALQDLTNYLKRYDTEGKTGDVPEGITGDRRDDTGSSDQSGADDRGAAETTQRRTDTDSPADNEESRGEQVSGVEKHKQESYKKEASRLSEMFGVDIEVHENLDGVSKDVRKQIESGGRTPGWYQNGKVHIYLPHTISVKDLQQTFFHEVIAHKGMRELLGDRFNDVILDFFDKLPKEVQEQLLSRYKSFDVYKDKTDQELRVIAADEFIASVAESGEFMGVDQRTVLQRIVDAIKKFFNANNIEVQLADVERLANDYLRQSAENLQNKNRPRSQNSAEDIAFRHIQATIDIDGIERSTTNSEGKPIAQTEEGIRNFWQWFGDSKVVDAEGRPMVVYHGAQRGNGNFTIFRQNSHFGTKEQAKNRARGGKLIPVYLKITDPKTTYDMFNTPRAWDAAVDYAKSQGYDGLFYNNQVEGDGISYVAFNPNQIKSATGNTGAFDPNSNDIRFRTVNESGFYSTVEDALEKIKQEKGTPQQFKAMLLKNGAKQAELDWMDYDGTFTGKSVTKGKERKVLFVDEHGKNIVFDNGSYRIAVDDVNDAQYITLWHKEEVKGKEYWAKRGVLDAYSVKLNPDSRRNDNFIGIRAVEIEKGHKGKGFGKKMYQTLMDFADDKYTGILSYLPNRVNKKEVPRIYKSLGGKIVDGDYAIIDFPKQKTHNTITKSDIQDWIDQNRIEVQEVERGAPSKVEVKSIEPVSEKYATVFTVTFSDNSTVEVDLSGKYGSDPSDISEREIAEEAQRLRAEDDLTYEGDEVINPTKYSQYQLPGGENYKELLLTMPSKYRYFSKEMYDKYGEDWINNMTESELERKKQLEDTYESYFQSSHFDEPNILAHIRFNEREVNGERVLFIEEIQSDWAQEGKKRGFKDNNAESKINDLQKQLKSKYPDERMSDILSMTEDPLVNELTKLYDEKSYKKVPSMPFKKTDQWLNLALRRMMRYAAENGFDRIAWTTGEQQADRYDLSKHLKSIDWGKNDDGTYDIQGDLVQGGYYTKRKLDAKGIADNFGKEISEKITASDEKEGILKGLDLKVGGEGMKAFYDGIVPSAMSKLGKPFGAKVEEIGISTEKQNVTDEYVIKNARKVESIEQAEEILKSGKNEWIYNINGSNVYRLYDYNDIQDAIKSTGVFKVPINLTTVQSLPVTESMKESVMEGMPLFRTIDNVPSDNQQIFDAAKEKFGTTLDMREAGYILPDGSMLDFSGKHEVRGADTSFLDGERTVDHREISDIAYDFDGESTGVKTDMADFLDRGAIRIDYDAGAINLNVAPTKEQKDRLRRLIERNRGDVYIDFGKGWDTEHYVEYEGARASRVLADIDRYYSEGIKPEGTVMFREQAEAYERQLSDIKEKAIADGSFMKAPNGKPTNLNEKQWVQVRSKAFKDWFGDWENDPANASKVVDENGEPLVVYHTSDNEFSEFDKNKIGKNYTLRHGNGFYFSSSTLGHSQWGRNTGMFFINIRNIKKSSLSFREEAKENGFLNTYDNSVDITSYAKKIGVDGLFAGDSFNKEFIVFEPNQIKSAIGNTGSFDAQTDDIRFRDVYGGNSGYIGYSMSRRAAQARSEGRYPKTDFKKVYGLSEKVFKRLVDAGVLNDSEWHHTSMYGNRTTFYSWDGDHYHDIYEQNRDRVDKLIADNKLDELYDFFYNEDRRITEEWENSTERRTDKARIDIAREYNRYQGTQVNMLTKDVYEASNGMTVVPKHVGNYKDVRVEVGGIELTRKSGGEERRKAIREYRDYIESNILPYSEWLSANMENIGPILEKHGITESDLIASIEDNVRFRERTDAPPKNIGKAYKVFKLINGKLYPPMVANPNAEHTPMGVWLDADASPVVGTSKTGRPQVKAAGGGRLAFRPGWHLGTIPYASQFNRKDADGNMTLFPANFVWAEVEYAKDIDYQKEAKSYGISESGKFRHSYAGLPRIPENGSYLYRTNPNPKTDAWIITGAMKVNKLLTASQVDALAIEAGREPQKRQDGFITSEQIRAFNRVNKAVETGDNTLFRVIGEIGVSRLDGAEKILDNLRVAKQMEIRPDISLNEIKLTTGWERGADRKWRYEQPDGKPITENLYSPEDGVMTTHESDEDAADIANAPKLSEVWDDAELFKTYPKIADIKVIGIYGHVVDKPSGIYGTEKGVKVINAVAPDADAWRMVMVHEIQHAIQDIEGFARGGDHSIIERGLVSVRDTQTAETLNPYTAYRRLAGEVEARNVSRRRDFTAEERRRMLLEDSEDVERSQQIVLRGVAEDTMFREADISGEKFGDSDKTATFVEENSKGHGTGEAIQQTLQFKGEEATYTDTAADDIQRKGSAEPDTRNIRTEAGAGALIRPLRKLKKGEMCFVQRKMSEDKNFSFTGANQIESTEDVAYIFKQLENKAVENAFLVFIKDGKATVLHVGMGNLSSTIFDTVPIAVMLSNIKPDTVYMVHNHPSGDVVASNQDHETYNRIKGIVKTHSPKTKLGEGIIIDTKSGIYGIFGESPTEFQISLMETIKKEAAKKPLYETNIPVYKFDELAFSKDYDPLKLTRIKNSRDIANFVATHRLGERDKVNILCINTSGHVVGNFFTDITTLKSDKDAKRLAGLCAEYVGMTGARSVAVFGSGVAPASAAKGAELKYWHKFRYAARNMQVSLLDIISVDNLYGTHSSYADNDLMETTAAYGEQEREESTEVEDVRFNETRRERKERLESDWELLKKEQGLAVANYDRRLANTAVKVYEATTDNCRSVIELQKAVTAETGKTLKSYENVYWLKLDETSRTQPAQWNFARFFYEPLTDEVRRIIQSNTTGIVGYRKAYKELSDYLMAKHGLERNDKFAMRDAQKAFEAYEKAHPNTGKTVEDFYADFRKRDYSGLTALTDKKKTEDAEAMAQAMVEAYESANDTKELWRLINRSTKEILRISYNGSMISKQTYIDLVTMFDYYIPLRGFDETTSDEVYSYVGTVNSPYNTAIKSARGRRSRAEDPLATIGNMADSEIINVHKNVAKRALLSLAENHRTNLLSVSEVMYVKDANTGNWVMSMPLFDDGDTAEEVTAKMIEHRHWFAAQMMIDPDNYKMGTDAINIPYKVVSSKALSEHQVLVTRGGQKYIVTINGNPRAAQAINGKLNPDAYYSALSPIRAVNRFLAKMFTQYNPEFVFSNLTRDGHYANTMVWVRENRDYAEDYNKNWVVSFKDTPRLLHKYKNGTLDTSVPIERYYKEFIEHGGETGYTRLLSVTDYKKQMERKLRGASRHSPLEVANKVVGGYLDTIEDLNRWAEGVSRFAAFLTSREHGRDIIRSVNDAKEITVNFNRKGAGTALMKAGEKNAAAITAALVTQFGREGYVFFNASIQALDNYAKAGKKNPGKFTSLVIGNIMTGFVMAMLYGDDDDYLNLPPYVRRNNLCAKVDGKWVTIPLSHEHRGFFGLGELAYMVMSGREFYDDNELMTEILSQFSQMLPVDFLESNEADLVMTMMPTSVRPAVEAYVNKDWTGSPIYSDSPYNKHDPEWRKAFRYTSPTLVSATRKLSDATGGSVGRGGSINLNPAIIEHLFESYLGGVGTTFNKAYKTVRAIAGDKQMQEIRNVPVVSRFVRQTDGQAAVRAENSRYYDVRDYVEGITNEERRLRQMAAEKEITGLDYDADDIAATIQKLQELRASNKWAFVQRWKALDKARSAAQEAGEEEQMYNITKQANDLYKELRRSKMEDMPVGTTK